MSILNFDLVLDDNSKHRPVRRTQQRSYSARPGRRTLSHFDMRDALQSMKKSSQTTAKPKVTYNKSIAIEEDESIMDGIMRGITNSKSHNPIQTSNDLEILSGNLYQRDGLSNLNTESIAYDSMQLPGGDVSLANYPHDGIITRSIHLDYLSDQDKSALKLGRHLLSSILESSNVSSLDQVSRFFIDTWLSKSGSSYQRADSLSITLLCSLENIKTSLGLSEDEILSKPNKLLCSAACEALDIIVREFGASNPILKGIRDVLIPNIFSISNANEFRKLDDTTSPDNSSAVNNNYSALTGEKYIMGNFWCEEPQSNLNEIKNLKDIIDKMTVERHSNVKTIQELKEKIQEFEKLNYESVKKEFRTKLNNEAKEFERYKDEFRKALKLSQEDVNLQKNTIATLNSKIKSLEKELNDSKNLKFDSLTYSKLSKLEKCNLTKSIADPSLYPINSLVSDAGSILNVILHNTEEEIEDLISFLNQQLISYKSELNLEIKNFKISMKDSAEKIQLSKNYLEKFSNSELSVLDLYNLLCDEYKVLYISLENCRIEGDKLRKDLKEASLDFEKQMNNQHNLNTRHLDELNSQIAELNNKLESLSKENLRINLLLEESNNSLVVKENEATSLLLKIHNSDQELAEVQEKLLNINHSSDLEITSLRRELYETNKSIAELSGSNILIKNDLTEKLLKIDSLRVHNSELDAKYKISETKVCELENEKTKLLDHIKNFENKISSCENNIKQINDELGAKSDELIAITLKHESVIKEYQENMNKKEKDMNQLEATVASLKIQLVELNDKNKIEVSNLNKSLSDADVMIKNLNNELNSQKINNSEISKKLESLEQSKSNNEENMNTKLIIMQNENSVLIDQNQSMQIKTDELVFKNHELLDKLKEKNILISEQKSSSDYLKKELLEKISSLQRENDQLKSSLRAIELSPNTIQSASKVSKASVEFIEDIEPNESQTEFQNQSVNQIDIQSRELIPNAVNIIATDVNIQIKDTNDHKVYGAYHKPTKEFTDIATQVELIPVVHHAETQTVDIKPLTIDVACQYIDPYPDYSQILEKAIESIKKPKITSECSTQVDPVLKKSSYVQATVNPFPCDIGTQYIDPDPEFTLKCAEEEFEKKIKILQLPSFDSLITEKNQSRGILFNKSNKLEQETPKVSKGKTSKNDMSDWLHKDFPTIHSSFHSLSSPVLSRKKQSYSYDFGESINFTPERIVKNKDRQPVQMVEPFIGFIRSHEKQFAREIGVLKVQLSEAKSIVESVKSSLELFINTSQYCQYDDNSKHMFEKVLAALKDSSWIFETTSLYNHKKFLIKSDIYAQLKMMESYNTLSQEITETLLNYLNDSSIQDSDKKSMIDINNEMNLLASDMSAQIAQDGGWKHILYSDHGRVDREFPIEQFSLPEQVKILKEILSSVISEEKVSKDDLLIAFVDAKQDFTFKNKGTLETKAPQISTNSVHLEPPRLQLNYNTLLLKTQENSGKPLQGNASLIQKIIKSKKREKPQSPITKSY